jgi:hypothetical protein
MRTAGQQQRLSRTLEQRVGGQESRLGQRVGGQEERRSMRTRGSQDRRTISRSAQEQRATNLQQEMFRRYKENRDFEQARGSYRV